MVRRCPGQKASTEAAEAEAAGPSLEGEAGRAGLRLRAVEGVEAVWSLLEVTVRPESVPQMMALGAEEVPR